MRIFKIIIVNLFISCCLIITSGASANAETQDSKYAALVIDADSGAVLYQENAGKSRYPASLAKMMTIYLTFQALERGTITINKPLRVSGSAAAQQPSVIGLRPGQTISVQDALNAVIIKSANDAAVVLAEGLAGSEWQFGMLMTRTAKSLGMKHTTFVNASGLPDNRQVTTAYDLARLAVALRRDYPQYYPLFAKSSFTYAGRTFFSHNRVTKNYRGADGLKTGYIRASGFNLVTSARRGKKSLVGVVMGGRSIKSRDTNMVKLLDQAFYKIATNSPQAENDLQTASNIEPHTDENTPQAKLPSTTIPTPIFKNETIKTVTTATNSRQIFTRDVVMANMEPAEILPQQTTRVSDKDYNTTKRDIFQPTNTPVAVNNAQPFEKVSFEDIRPTRVKIQGKIIPTPTLRPDTAKRLVKGSPNNGRNYRVAEIR